MKMPNPHTIALCLLVLVASPLASAGLINSTKVLNISGLDLSETIAPGSPVEWNGQIFHWEDPPAFMFSDPILSHTGNNLKEVQISATGNITNFSFALNNETFDENLKIKAFPNIYVGFEIWTFDIKDPIDVTDDTQTRRTVVLSTPEFYNDTPLLEASELEPRNKSGIDISRVTRDATTAIDNFPFFTKNLPDIVHGGIDSNYLTGDNLTDENFFSLKAGDDFFDFFSTDIQKPLFFGIKPVVGATFERFEDEFGNLVPSAGARAQQAQGTADFNLEITYLFEEPAVIPTPGSLGLIGLGLMGFVGRRLSVRA